MKKRVLSLLLALALLLTALPRLSLPARAEDDPVYSGECGAQGGNLTWSFDPDTGELTIQGSGDMADMNVNRPPWTPFRDQITSLSLPEGLTSIGSCAFQKCSALEDLSFPSSLTAIQWDAFSECTALRRAVLPEHLNSLGPIAFMDCTSLDTLVLPASLETIPRLCFSHCDIRTLIVPEGCKTIGDGAFIGCDKLSFAVLPESLCSVEETAFFGCQLKSITLQNPDTVIGADENTLGSPSGTAIYGHPGSTAQTYAQEFGYTFSDLNNLRSGACGVQGDNLIWSLDLNSDELLIHGKGDMADYTYGAAPWYEYRNQINSLSLPEDLTGIGSYAFLMLQSLKALFLPDNLRAIGNRAFAGCSGLKYLDLPEGLSSLGAYAFYGCAGVSSLTLPESLTVIPNDCFSGCGIHFLIFPEGCETIEADAFWGCSQLVSVVLPSSLTAIGKDAFATCSILGSVTVRNPDCSIAASKNTLGDPVRTTIHGLYGSSAQSYAQQYGYSFELLDALLTGQCGAQGPNLVFTLDINGVLHIEGSGDMADYNYDSVPWSTYRHLICDVDLPDGITGISASAFSNCSKLTELALPGSLERLGSYCFSGCIGLTSLSLPGSIEKTDAGCFFGCVGLQSVELQEGIPYVACDMFNECTALRSVVIPASVTEIQDNAFRCCESLTEFTLPEGLTSIGAGAFHNCSALEQITLPESLCSLGESAFDGCELLRSVTIPDGVTCIEWRTFFDCKSLHSVSLPDHLTIIGPEAFLGCALRSVSLPASLRRIDEDAFLCCDNLNALIFQNNSCLICGQTAELEDSAETPQWQKRPNTLGSRSKTWLYVRQSEQPSAGGAARDIQRKYSSLTQYAAEYGYRLCPLDSFRDVSPSAYYAVPVTWAVENGITTGAGSGSFRPKQVCTREQVVTFLWKAAGSPKPGSSQRPFSDVKPGKYYYSAVLWAVEKGITSGSSAAKFGVGKPCTREQVVSFLWKALGSPAPAGTESPFTDVKPGKYYFSPVLWAVEHGVTSGATPTTFGVGRPCTRAQVVTFLYNAYVLNG